VGLGGRRFGTLITWFLVGGDVYTAYNLHRVPALAFGAGAVAFFACPIPSSSILAVPGVSAPLARVPPARILTAGDFVRAGSAIAGWPRDHAHGIVATMPYIALQLVGIQVVIGRWGCRDRAWRAICR